MIPPNFDTIPTDLVVLIFNQLPDSESIMSLAFASRRLRGVLMDNLPAIMQRLLYSLLCPAAGELLLLAAEADNVPPGNPEKIAEFIDLVSELISERDLLSEDQPGCRRLLPCHFYTPRNLAKAGALGLAIRVFVPASLVALGSPIAMKMLGRCIMETAANPFYPKSRHMGHPFKPVVLPELQTKYWRYVDPIVMSETQAYLWLALETLFGNAY
ncbi:hypothetical protein DL768_004763 [Monosporascus sp. mg162]|nr:hypothetical protein DL768_004763 [Monosporascus sp. mg162]